MRIAVASTGRILAEHADLAAGPVARAKGLIGRRAVGEGDALVFPRARQIHTFGMGFPIDVIFCDGDGVILYVVRDMRPMRVTRWVRGARYAIELRSGSVGLDVAPGGKLDLTATESGTPG